MLLTLEMASAGESYHVGSSLSLHKLSLPESADLHLMVWSHKHRRANFSTLTYKPNAIASEQDAVVIGLTKEQQTEELSAE